MDKKKWKRISRIFDLALSLPPNQRTNYIHRLCSDKPELQHEVHQLLQSAEESEGLANHHLQNNRALLENFATHINMTVPEIEDSLEGETIDQWELIELLDHGGMGSVYKARLVDSEIHQIGALKIMHQNLKTPANIQRFKLEQQILAELNHPNIAHRIDGGITKNGLPYLVMEYIDGIPLLEYCDKHQLTVKKRLNLFLGICDAVQYAHKNLVVHRDLKPQNILVTGQGHIKILDFGIAKLLDPNLYELSAIKTRPGLRLMSPEYASPEQVGGEAVTTASDQYTLGILLYELMGGLHPFDVENKQYSEITDAISSQAPPYPHQRLQDLNNGVKVSKIAKKRSTQPQKLIKTLRGDLLSIIQKTLRKEPEARYDSISQLKDDISLYLQNKPLLAKKDVIKYRIVKFIKRHGKKIAAAISFILILTSLIGYYTIKLADERDTARLEAKKAEQVKTLLIDIFQSGDPFSQTGSKDITVREVLDRGVTKIKNTLQKQPLVRAELLGALGNVYTGLALYPKAKPLLKNTVDIYANELGTNHQNVAYTTNKLGYLLLRQGNYHKAEASFKRSKQIFKKNLGKNNPDFAYALKMLGFLYSETGRPQKALSHYQRAINIYEANSSPAITGALNDLGYLLKDLGEFKKAEATLQRCLNMLSDKKQARISHANALSGIAQIKHQKGELVEAEKQFRRVLSMRKKAFPPGHTYIAASQLRLGWVVIEQGHSSKAIPLVQNAFRSFKQHLPSEHWKVAAAQGILALIDIEQGKYEQAENTLLRTHQIFKEQFGNNNWRTQRSKKALSKLYSVWDKPNLAAQFTP
ncbi:protein kinase domain-containing protein [Fodinibius halophilus]|uniref:Serine/threonine protein kinase n=1 Tax=Fodinibius halophilus TaxID=1736908 RepID=A0A6M1STG1_9BACT|nr:tetratricopeptide repeat protein [Fodinibius halophilus]NGP87218.1 serine/threonine protein kinase [Fodinibius halophilus]